MKCSYYKYCMVPFCSNTTIKTPNKLFIYVPNNENRQKWLKLAGRGDADGLSVNSRMYFCEDHFDLPKDMANYMEYHLMGKVSAIRMKPGCMPTKFDCQPDRSPTSDTMELKIQESKKDSEPDQISTESTVFEKGDSDWDYPGHVVKVELVEEEDCFQPPA